MTDRWLVVGHLGMLGTDLMQQLAGRDVTGIDRPDIDITNERSVRDVIHGFDYVVNCAAYTAVDAAEADEETALAVNGTGAGNLAAACARIGARLVHISTDYVFDGQSTTPYAEDHPTAPRSAYGRTKAAGEVAVLRELFDDSLILRTAWLYGAHGPNFVRTMINLERTRDTLDVVDDQFGQPTWTHDLAERIVECIDRRIPAGIYHATSSGSTTWFGFTRRIFELLGADMNRVHPTTTDAFPRPAPRPAFSVLGHQAWERAGLAPLRTWQAALDAAWPEMVASS